MFQSPCSVCALVRIIDILTISPWTVDLAFQVRKSFVRKQTGLVAIEFIASPMGTTVFFIFVFQRFDFICVPA